MSFNRKKYGLFCKYVYIFAVILQKYSDNSICFFSVKTPWFCFYSLLILKRTIQINMIWLWQPKQSKEQWHIFSVTSWVHDSVKYISFINVLTFIKVFNILFKFFFTDNMNCSLRNIITFLGNHIETRSFQCYLFLVFCMLVTPFYLANKRFSNINNQLFSVN